MEITPFLLSWSYELLPTGDIVHQATWLSQQSTMLFASRGMVSTVGPNQIQGIMQTIHALLATDNLGPH